MDLYQRVCDSVGSSKMERLEFGFKFADIVKERFPELDTMVLQESEGIYVLTLLCSNSRLTM